MSSEFKVHVIPTNWATNEDAQHYLSNVSEEIDQGFKPNTAAKSAAVNAILHETSLFVVGLNNFLSDSADGGATDAAHTPDNTAAEINAAFKDKLAKFIGTKTANKVSNTFTIKLNSTTGTAYDGSQAKTVGPFYAPTYAGSEGRILLSGGNVNAPYWCTSTIGSQTTMPVYVLNGVIKPCSLYAGGTLVTLNGSPKPATTAEFYAPESGPNGEENKIIVSGKAATAYKPEWHANPFYTFAPAYHPAPAGFDSYVYCNAASTTRVTHLNTIVKDTSRPSDSSPRIYNFSTAVEYDRTNNVVKQLHFFSEDFTETAAGRATSYVPMRFDWCRWVRRSTDDNYTGGEIMSLRLINHTSTNAGVGQLWVDSGGVETYGPVRASEYYASSDERLKAHIEDYEPKKSILDLPIKQFDIKETGTHHIGCIAQDLQNICPEIVHENTEGYLEIEENKLIYLLLNEVKKLRKEIDELKGAK